MWRLGRTYRSSAGDVRWDALGERGARPVVLLHGTPFSSYVWRAVARALAQRYRVFVWDMPGYGNSEKFDGQDVSLAAQARVFTELLDEWGQSAPTVVAHDIGGAVALRARLCHDARYDRLALVDPVALRPWGSPFFRLVRQHAEVFGQLPAGLHEALVRGYVRSATAGELPPSVLDQLVAPWLGEDGQPAFYRQIAQADQRYTDEVQDRYDELDMPVLVAWGTRDAWIPVAKAEELTALIPGAQQLLIDGAGHLVQEDAPAELTAALLEFLRG